MDTDGTAQTQREARSLVDLYIRNMDAAYLVFAAVMLGAWLFADLSEGYAWAFMAGNAIVITIFAWMNRSEVRRPSVKAATIRRIVLACFVLPFDYFQSGPLIEQVRLSAVPDIEALLLKWDLQLMGQAYHDWIASIRVPWITEVLQLLYASFYFLPLSLCFLLVVRKKSWSLAPALFGVATGFLVSYVGYLIVPGRSPAFLDESLVHTGGIWIATDVWNHVREAGRGAYDVFPSGHTALSLIVVYYAWRFDRLAFALLTPVALCVVVSTIYLQYHYLVDVPAGIALTLLIVWWDRRIRRIAPPTPTLQESWAS